jgi:hypothetical protein
MELYLSLSIGLAAPLGAVVRMIMWPPEAKKYSLFVMVLTAVGCCSFSAPLVVLSLSFGNIYASLAMIVASALLVPCGVLGVPRRLLGL